MDTNTYKASAGDSRAGLRNGTECWAWLYDWPRGTSLPSAVMKPVRGVLAQTNSAVGDVSRLPEWFVPYRKGTRTPAWTKAVRIEVLNLHSGEDAAKSAYNAAVKAVINRFEDLIRMAKQDMV